LADGNEKMTDVAFHVNVANPLGYACRLVRKAYLRGMSVLVLGEARQVAALDAQLWGMRPVEFVPHCQAAEEAGLLARSSVVLADSMAQAPQRAFDALLNLTNEVPDGYQAFGRLFEVVSMDEAHLQAARRRWRVYQDDGLTPKRHEIGG
jgi:DNA polymerase III subunit chi